MRLAFALVVAAACGKYSEADVGRLEAEIDADNGHRYDAALAAALRAHDLVEIASPPAPTEPVTVPSGGPPEQVDGDVLVIASQCGGGSCECPHDIEYHFARDRAGAIWLVRMHIERQTRVVHQQGACGFGCGVPMPAEPSQ